MVCIKTLICIPMETLKYDVSEKKNEIEQSAAMTRDAILDFLAIIRTSVS